MIYVPVQLHHLVNSQEHHSKQPDLEVCSWREEISEAETLRIGVLTVAVDTANDAGSLPLGEKAPGPVSRVREVHGEDVAEDADETGQ